MPNCPEYPNCTDRREADALFRGEVKAKLEGIKSGVDGLWTAMEVNRTDIKHLYFRMGLISGGTSLIVSLVVAFVAHMVK